MGADQPIEGAKRKAARRSRGSDVEGRLRSEILKGILIGVAVTAVTSIAISASHLGPGAVDAFEGFFEAGESSTSREVGELFEEVGREAYWAFPPTMSRPGRAVLERHWENLRPDKIHTFPRRAARWRTLDELFQDTALDGHPLLLTAFVDQTYGAVPVQGGPGMVKEGFRLDTGTSETVAWCIPSVFRRGDAPVVDQLVKVKATVAARGSKTDDTGGSVGGSDLVCSAVHALVPATIATEMASLTRPVETSAIWADPPSMSEGGWEYLSHHWVETSPFRLHRFPRSPPREFGLDELSSDRRFDDGELLIGGVVTQRSLYPSERGEGREDFRLGLKSQDDAAWCTTTVPPRRLLGEGEYVEAVGIPVARGAAAISTGGFQNTTYLDCPAVQAP
jgi:hypothetical protein